MLQISPTLAISLAEVHISQIRAQGAGGQNVNKVSSAVQLRFNIGSSSLPESIKKKLLSMPDRRITNNGEVVIKSQNHRTFARNKEEALNRLASLIRRAAIVHKRRKATKPGKRAQKKRLDRKTQHGKLKQLRKKVDM